ncbi:MAG: hypothetical protein NC086_10140 [Alistipes sp.]|nr:hypothetical protein [Alistipes sp.]
MKKIILGISISLIGLLMIPTGIFATLIYFIWSGTDKLIRLLERKKDNASVYDGNSLS